MDPAHQVLTYHEETKHAYQRYARARGFLDWDHQPSPFRTYQGTLQGLLPLLAADPDGAHLDLYERGNNPTWDLTLESIGAFLELSMGLSAWKEIPGGSKWALRMNPSSGNLHPTECHLILPSLIGARPAAAKVTGSQLSSGLYHYHSYAHAL